MVKPMFGISNCDIYKFNKYELFNITIGGNQVNRITNDLFGFVIKLKAYE